MLQAIIPESAAWDLEEEKQPKNKTKKNRK
jgi:hypothetical protein